MFLLKLLWLILRTLVVVTLRRLLRGRLHPQWQWRLEVLVELMRASVAWTAGAQPRHVRARLGAAPLPSALARTVAIAPTTIAGLTAECHTPTGWDDGDVTILYLHGGGYALCSPATHRELVARLARACRARCIAIRYRLAPEHRFPAATDDALAACRALLAAPDVPRERLLLAGDSAGGGLCLATLLRLRDAGEPLPAAAILLSPWVDLTASGETIDTNARYDYLSRELLATYAAHYLGDASCRDPLATAVLADLRGLPPLLVHSGGGELLLAEHERLVERARAAGVSVTHEVFAGMIHAWHAFARFLPQSRAAIEAVGRYVARLREQGR